MSDFLFDEVPVPGKTVYKYGDWKTYAVHTTAEIKGFFGGYRYLSNFEPVEIWFEGLKYPSTEHAYQAAKIVQDERGKFLGITMADAKRLWKKLPPLYSASEWDAIKYRIMFELVFQKFLRHTELKDKLMRTGDAHLEELNHWGDMFWGVDIKKGGLNNLGKILMRVRTALR